MICNRYVQFFSSLSDKTRLEIIKILRERDQSVGELCEKTEFEQSRVSHNLKKLKELGFVNVEKKGKQRVYSLDKTTVAPLLELIDKHVEKYYTHYCRCNNITQKKGE